MFFGGLTVLILFLIYPKKGLDVMVLKLYWHAHVENPFDTTHIFNGLACFIAANEIPLYSHLTLSKLEIPINTPIPSTC